MTALTIAFVPGVSPAKWARVWRDRFPDVELVLRPIGAGEVDDALAGDADMVFARMPVADVHHAIPLWTETAVVAMPKDADLAAAEELSDDDLAAVHVVDPGPIPADIDGALDLVEANVGVVVLPQSLFRAANRRSLVARPLVGAPGTRIALVWRDADASELTDEFIGVVRGRTANSSRGDARPGGSDADPDDASRPRGAGSGTGRAGSGTGRAGSGTDRAGSGTGRGGPGQSGAGRAGAGRGTRGTAQRGGPRRGGPRGGKGGGKGGRSNGGKGRR